MKFFIHLLIFLIYPTIIFTDEKKLPFNIDNIQSIYKLNNGNIIYIEQYNNEEFFLLYK